MPNGLFENVESMKEEMRAIHRHRFGFDEAPAEKIFQTVCLVLTSLPHDRLKAHLEKLATSGNKLDRLHARQLSFILFAAAEIEKALDEIPPGDKAEVLLELVRRLKEE